MALTPVTTDWVERRAENLPPGIREYIENARARDLG
jgi:hypothetical protein